MESLNKIISSFDPQSKLEPNIWLGDKINPKVRKNLLEIANQFIDSFKLDVVIEDIIVTGSIANYNWSKYSDIDLHILVDYSQFSKKTKEMYIEFFDLKKIIFNQKRNIKIYGYDVEVYVEDSDIEAISDAVYSLMEDDWVKKPTKGKFKKPDVSLVRKKAKQWMRIIDNVLKNIKNEKPQDILNALKKCKDKLKKYRLCGLEKGGETSIENYVFKVLRRIGYIEKLYNVPIKMIDNKLSLQEGNTKVNGVFSTDLENSPKHHAARGFGNWESDNAWDMFAPIGTKVYSYTDGKVGNVKNYGQNSGKVYGTGIIVRGTNNYPDIFYTHLKNVKLKIGDTVEVGDYIGEISEWPGHTGIEHVHVGLPYGKHIRDLIDGVVPKPESTSDEEIDLEIDDEEYDKILETIFNFNPKLKENDKPELIDPIKEKETLRTILNWIKENKKIEESGKVITKDNNIKTLQEVLQFLGYLDKNYGLDGYYDEKTINAVKSFKKDFNLSEDGNLVNKDFMILYYLLVYSLFDDSEIVIEPNYNELKLTTMNNFYEMVLIGLDADITYTNLKFLKAWNDVTTIGGEENPFGLIYLRDTEKEKPIEKTIKTLKSDEYFCLLNNLRQNLKIEQILNCRFFDKDNLRTKIENYLKTE